VSGDHQKPATTTHPWTGPDRAPTSKQHRQPHCDSASYTATVTATFTVIATSQPRQPATANSSHNHNINASFSHVSVHPFVRIRVSCLVDTCTCNMRHALRPLSWLFAFGDACGRDAEQLVLLYSSSHLFICICMLRVICICVHTYTYTCISWRSKETLIVLRHDDRAQHQPCACRVCMSLSNRKKETPKKSRMLQENG
jgi:hypothetical protein